MRQLVDRVLDEDFGIGVHTTSLAAAHSFNHIFRCDTTDGRRLAVRVGGSQRIHHPGVETVEASWLDALMTARFPVATMLRTADDQCVAAAQSESVAGVRPMSVFTWVRGRPVRERLTLDAVERIGRMHAQLHAHAADWSPDVDVPPGVFADRVVYFLDESLLAHHQSAHGSLFVEAIERAQRVIDQLWLHPPHPPHLLHGDFGPNNVLRFGAALTAIDFQDLQFGFDVQDLGLTISDLRRAYADESIVDALRRGYRSARPWPADDEGLLGDLAAARSLNMMNLGLNLRRSGFTEFFDRHAEIIRRWMLSPA